MAASKSETIVRDLLGMADVQVNGPHPWDPQVHDPRLYNRIIQEVSLGFGEACLAGCGAGWRGDEGWNWRLPIVDC